MGAFDWVELPNGEWGQVKCWGRILDSYRPGDNVGPVDNVGTYSIALIEGGYLNVSDDVFTDVTDEPRYTRIFDKWGDEYEPECYGKNHPMKKIIERVTEGVFDAGWD